MKIVLASDHAGFELKEGVAEFLRSCGIDFDDIGCGPGETVDYVDYGSRGARTIVEGRCDRGILICGTGLGMALVANKFKGIRATPCSTEYASVMSRKHNDSNCLTLGGRTLALEATLPIVRIWLETEFEGGRHGLRVQKILDIENENFK